MPATVKKCCKCGDIINSESYYIFGSNLENVLCKKCYRMVKLNDNIKKIVSPGAVDQMDISIKKTKVKRLTEIPHHTITDSLDRITESTEFEIIEVGEEKIEN